MTGFYQQTTDYNQFHIIGGTFTGYRLECWACDTALPWEEEHGCLELGEMVRIADEHWPVHAGRPIPPPPSTPTVHAQLMRPSEPQFTGCLADLAEEEEQ